MKNLLLFLGLLLTSVYLSCAGKAKNAAVESAGNIKDTAVESAGNIKDTADFNTNVNTVADADDFVEKTKVLDVPAKDGKEAIDLAAKDTKKVVEKPTQNTGDVVRNTEEKAKDVDVAIKHTEKVVEKATQNTGDVVRDAEEKTKDTDVAVDNSKQSIEGIWDTGTENTKIEILQNNGEWVGKIKSSDNEKATIGKVILKDLKKQNEKWKGKLFVVKKQKWTDVEIIPNGTKLDLTVSAGFSSKKVQWSNGNN